MQVESCGHFFQSEQVHSLVLLLKARALEAFCSIGCHPQKFTATIPVTFGLVPLRDKDGA
jgi:hypothetical protein